MGPHRATVGRGRRGGGRRSCARPGCVVLDGGPAGEPLGFGGGAGWWCLHGNRAGASPAGGGVGVAGERSQGWAPSGGGEAGEVRGRRHYLQDGNKERRRSRRGDASGLERAT
jgi:hypothetical protein